MFKNMLMHHYQKKIQRYTPPVQISFHKEIPIPSARQIVALSEIVSRINVLEDSIKALSDSAFIDKTRAYQKELQARLQVTTDKKEQGMIIDEYLDQILPEAFALVREAARRTIGLRHFDVQLLGGLVLHKGMIAEMATGEGKTLVATLAAYTNALAGKGVHVVTVNDYLAKRDREWMGPVYEFLGLNVGVIQQDMHPALRKVAYACDITYGTNNEFGFDYLRDNMVVDTEEIVQRQLQYCIIDEVDSILIDEARTPLIISGSTDFSTDAYQRADQISQRLKGRMITEKEEIDAKYKGEDLSEGYDYIIDEKAHTAALTDEGIQKCEDILGVKDIYHDFQSQWLHLISQSLRAHKLFKIDRDYIIKDGKIIIVDEFTGRLMPGRRWSDGLHQAVEAKEGLKVQEESQTLATITLQNYFKMYSKRSGMTGTAYTEAGEFQHIYELDTVVIPTNRPFARGNYSDQIYKTEAAKFDAIVKEIIELHEQGRPILVGTNSIENSEKLAFLLKKKGIPHNVLNAKYHEMEAQIVAQAGRYKQVTIATNMAGRGTDIILGGNIEFLVKDILRKKQVEPQTPEYQQEYTHLIQEYRGKFNEEHAKVVSLGGLHVIGAQRHEARRIDNQLRGRSGRQGDPGSSRFYVSLQDDLMRLFGSERITLIMDKMGFPEDEPIEHTLVTHSIEVAQKRVEGQHFEVRKQLFEYDNVMNTQRDIIYSQRKDVLTLDSLRDLIFNMAEEVLEKVFAIYLPESVSADEWDRAGLCRWLKMKLGIDFEEDGSFEDRTEIGERIIQKVEDVYDQKQSEAEQAARRAMERMIILSVIDARWREHLQVMDSLREGIHLRAHAHREPLVEYQHEAYMAFSNMVDSIKENALESVFKIKSIGADDAEIKPVPAKPLAYKHDQFITRTDDVSEEQMPPKTSAQPISAGPKVGRNELCPCGSGKKYKKCCGI